MSNMDQLLLFAAFSIPAALLAVRYWRGAIFGVFVLLVFEGALRKWAFPWAQAQIYLVKDAVLLAAYMGFVFSTANSQPAFKELNLIKAVLVLAFAFGCFELLNPNSPSVLVGLIGLKTYFLYAPVAFILPYAFSSRQHLLVSIRRYLVIAIPVAIFGFVQAAAGPDSSLNAYVSHSEDIAVTVRFGRDLDMVRTSGTFSYIAGYATFLSFIAFLAIGYNFAQGWRIKNNIIPLLSLTLVIGAMFTTGSRSPVYVLVGAIPIILWLATAAKIISVRIAARVGILVPVVLFVALNISPHAYEAFVDRATDNATDDSLSRILEPALQTFEAITSAPLFGFGIGTTHPSALSIMEVDWPWWLNDLVLEGEMARVTVETGITGLVLIYILRGYITLFTLRRAMSFRDPAYRAFGIVLTIYLALGMVIPVIFNATAGLYYWGAFGLMLTMLRLEHQQSALVRKRAVARAGQDKLQPSTIHAR